MDLLKFRVYLRAFELDDYETTHAWRKDQDILKGIVGMKYFVSSEYEKKWMNDAIFNNDSIKLAICLKEADRHVGNVYLTNIDHVNKNCMFGIFLGDKSTWGKGLASEATILILNHAFYELGMVRVSSRQLSNNKSSIKLHERCGFKQEGVLRKAVFKNGEYSDLNLMSILREDFDYLIEAYD